MNQTFRDWEPDQVWLLPPSLQDLVPAGHLAHVVRDLVADGLDLSALPVSRGNGCGDLPYHPGMMAALLLYAYSQGVYSSRQIARGCEERLDFAAVTALQRPDFRAIGEFRKRHGAALKGLFVEALRLCRKTGLERLGQVALEPAPAKGGDGRIETAKPRRGQAGEKGARLAAEVAAWLKAASRADRVEDRAHGVDRRGDEGPDWAASRERRRARIREAKAALEAETRAAAEKPARSRPIATDREKRQTARHSK